MTRNAATASVVEVVVVVFVEVMEPDVIEVVSTTEVEEDEDEAEEQLITNPSAQITPASIKTVGLSQKKSQKRAAKSIAQRATGAAKRGITMASLSLMCKNAKTKAGGQRA